MDQFQEALNHCGFSPISSKGLKFTWANNQVGVDFTKEKLDKVVANMIGMSLFSVSFNIILP